MNYLATIEKWLLETLTDLPGVVGGVHNGVVIQGEPTPYALFSLQGNRTETALCGDVCAVYAVYAVRVVGVDTGYEPLTEAETEILARLDNVFVVIGEAGLSVTLQSPLRRATANAGGSDYYEAGGLFAVLLTP
ncbi:MAG: hypothetical protein H7Y38_16080 [Armatimonadetes bacterium]|nr:hypothetical protein [Armatimonadota bacterium]